MAISAKTLYPKSKQIYKVFRTYNYLQNMACDRMPYSMIHLGMNFVS